MDKSSIKLSLIFLFAGFSFLICSLCFASQALAAEWSIGIYEGSSPLNLAPIPGTPSPVLTARDVNDVPAEFVADPFLVQESGTWYLFFEVLNSRNNQGDIGYATSGDGRHWNYRGIVLNESFHLSYPYVFKWQGTYYMVPETYQANAIRLYRATRFPDRWAFVSTLVTGRRYVDPSPFYYNSIWWMFAGLGNNRLFLFYADKLTGPWIEHPRSPLISNNPNIARPGGRVLQFNGRLLRIAQDDSPTYGNQVRAFEVTRLTKTAYAEFEVSQSPLMSATGSGWNADGMHHMSAVRLTSGRWLAAVDGLGGDTGDSCVISDGRNEAALQPGDVVSSVRQYLGDFGVRVTNYGDASASIYKWTSFSGFITDVNAGETWDDGTFNSIECLDGASPAGDSCVISDGRNEAVLQPGDVVSSVRQYLGDFGVRVSSYGDASASIYKWTSFSGFITDVDAGETWDDGTFNSIECR